MGLDTYIFSVESPKDDKELPDVVPGADFPYHFLSLTEEAYWRKNYFINSYIGELFMQKKKNKPKAGVDFITDKPQEDTLGIDFNGVYVKVTYSDINRLKRKINMLPHSAWEVNSLDPKKYPTIRLLRKVLREMKDNAGKRTFYAMSNW